MRLVEFDKKTAKLPNDIVTQLSKRFNVKHAEQVLIGNKEDGCIKYVINIPCVLCDEYYGDNQCYECPLAIFETAEDFSKRIKIPVTVRGCFNILDHIMKEQKTKPIIHINKKCVWWLGAFDSSAKKQLQCIRDYLKNLPRIKGA